MFGSGNKKKREAKRAARRQRKQKRKERKQEKQSARSSTGKGIFARAIKSVVDSQRRVKFQYWLGASNFKSFPEQSEPDILQRPNTGICFSGGGTRSASASVGYMRALHDLGFENQIRYVIGISGGSWFSVPYTFLPNKFTDDAFLGKTVSPGECTPDFLKKLGADTNIFEHSITRSKMLTTKNIANMVGRWGRPSLTPGNKKSDETWGDILGRIFLDPIDLYSKKQKYMTWNQNSLLRLLRNNAHLDTTDFTKTERNRPFLIVGSCIMAARVLAMIRRMLSKKLPFFFAFEFTPLYAGNHVRYDRKKTFSLFNLGGGYIEPIAFDSSAPFWPISNDNDKTKVRARKYFNRLSLQDVMATSGAAPAHHLRVASSVAPLVPAPLSLKGIIKIANSIFPKYKYWPLVPGKKVRGRNIPFGDGGFVDNYGILPLIKRKVDNIIVFINTNIELVAGENVNISDSSISDWRDLNIKKIDQTLPLLFGIDDLVDAAPEKWMRGGSGQLFESKDFVGTVRGLLNSMDEGPCFHRSTYRIKRNRFHDIEPYDAEVVWIYLSLPASWLPQLDPITCDSLVKNKKEKEGVFKNFPHYNTFLENKNGVVILEPEQVQLLSQLASWTITEINAKNGFNRIFN